MLDTHAIARSLAKTKLTPAQVDAIVNAIRQAAEQGPHVTPDQVQGGNRRAEGGDPNLVRTEIGELGRQLSTQIANTGTRLGR